MSAAKDPGSRNGTTPQAGTSALDAALDYAGRGWRVLPLHSPDPGHASGCSCRRRDCQSPGKHPRTSRGVKDATTDPERVRQWWKRWPDANVGVATGNGLAVLDVDPRNDGDAALQELEEAHGEILTLTARTGGGGLHLYLSGDLPSRGSLRPGLDLQGAGKYVVAPPSRHVSGGCYSFTDPEESPRVSPPWRAR